MSKNTKIILIVVIIVLLIFGIVLAVYNHFKSEPMDANTTKENNILDDANSGLENFINDILDEENNITVENTEVKNTTTNTHNTQASNTQSQAQSSSNNSGAENQTTPGEQKAVELVKEEWKKEWGNLNDVSFNNVMIQSDGKYVVSVNDSKTTKVIRRYIVDTITGLVEEKD